jgi:hypothetical protein
MEWSVYQHAVSEATQGRAMGVMGVLVSGDSDQRPKRIERQEGEIAKFTTSVTPQSTAWLVQNAARFKCRHTVVGAHKGKPSHIIVGPADKIGAIFNNKEARAAGLTEKVRKARVDANDAGAAPGRDSTKPIVSHVAAQAVQTNIASPSAPPISEHNDLGHEDQNPASEAESTATSAKMYTYASSPMPSSNAFHGGRVRATYAQFFRDGSHDSLSSNAIPANVTPVNHDDHDIFYDACDLLAMILMETNFHHLRSPLGSHSYHLSGVLLRAGNMLL